jgi:deazaflavin-dependent oxidoreductase (nitroreductase family)
MIDQTERNVRPMTAQDGLPPVRPSLIVRVVIKPMTKVLNPIIRKLAGRQHFFMAAQIRHVGRRTGRRYVTPASAHADGDAVIIPLTFGNQSDWVRNVRASGGCGIRLNGVDYEAVEPHLVDAADVRPTIRSVFNPVERVGLRVLGIKQFLRLRLVRQSA